MRLQLLIIQFKQLHYFCQNFQLYELKNHLKNIKCENTTRILSILLFLNFSTSCRITKNIHV